MKNIKINKHHFTKLALSVFFASNAICFLKIHHANAAEIANQASGNQAIVNGYIRSYNWTNHNFYFSGSNNNALAIGGKLHMQSKKYNNFSVGGAFYFSHTPFNNSRNIDPTLGQDIDTIGEAYMDYKDSLLDIKAGRLTLDTPFANSADFRMVPALYGGETISLVPFKNVSIFGAHINYFKSWTHSGFSRNNNYTAGPFTINNPFNTSGFLTFGIKDSLALSTSKLNSELWYYHFYNIANLSFINEKLSLPTTKYFNPFLGMQYVRETGSGENQLGNVNSQVIGFKAGMGFLNGSVSAAVDHIPAKTGGAVSNGGLVSPYTHTFGSADLYTQNLLFATEDQGSGNAYILSGNYNFTSQFSGWAAYNQFNMRTGSNPAPNIKEYTISGTYSFSKFKGLSLTNMLAIATQASQTFWQNRLLLQYNF